MIEWHVAETPLANYIRRFAMDNGLNNIAVFNTRPGAP
jgi:hypothetical protein